MKAYRSLLAGLAVLGFSVAVHAAPITLVNGDFESGDAPGAGNITTGGVKTWGPNGADFLHSAASAPGNAGLGLQFAYYTPSGEHVGQVTAATLTAGNSYTFKSYAVGGGNGTGTISYFLGYLNDSADLTDGLQVADFTIFATEEYATTGTWAEYAGVTAEPTAAALSKLLVVGWNPNLASNPDDIWFDSASASFDVVPEPASLALLGLGGLIAIRRRR